MILTNRGPVSSHPLRAPLKYRQKPLTRWGENSPKKFDLATWSIQNLPLIHSYTAAPLVIDAAVVPADWGNHFIEDRGKLDGVEGKRLVGKVVLQIRSVDRTPFRQEQGDFYGQCPRDKGEIHTHNDTPSAGDR